MELVRCLIYFALTGLIAFIAGRLVPKRWFDAREFPFRSFVFEQNGRIYNRLQIKAWQNKVPDMSKILPWAMPAKKMAAQNTPENLEQMLQETCVAELTHVVLCLAGLRCLVIWPGPGGLALYALYVLLGNLPFILIQRYNRPRLLQLWLRLEKKRKEMIVCAY